MGAAKIKTIHTTYLICSKLLRIDNHPTTAPSPVRPTTSQLLLGAAFSACCPANVQKYPKIPVIEEISAPRVGIAFDLMSVNFADLPALPHLLPALQVMFADENLAAQEETEESALYSAEQ
eukprot:1300926-Pyramimonas_sp.AAC.2